MGDSIWVYIDHFQGTASPTSWEALGAALTIAEKMEGRLAAVIFGSDGTKLAEEAISRGAEEVLVAEDALFKDFRPEPFTTVLASQVLKEKPLAVFFPNTIRGRELAAMLAVDLKVGVLPDVIALEVNDGRILATRPIYAGKLFLKVTCKTDPQLLTIRGRSFGSPPIDKSRSGSIRAITPEVNETDISTNVERYIQSADRVSLSDATVVVSGGRGVVNNPALQPPASVSEKDAEKWRAQQGFKLISDLAEVLGGAVGASRAVVDAGYIAYAHQVGQTGKIISPDLYFACGISGAIQHLAGMRTSKVIVAINRDPDAPIFKYARFGVVGDLYQILPALTEAFRSRLTR